LPDYIAPGSTYSSRLALGPASTGLVGTVRYRLLDNDAVADDPVYGPSLLAIIEDPSGSGDYVFRGTAPTMEGKYSPAWDTGPDTPLIFDEDIVVTRTAIGPSTPSGHEYVTRDELKNTLAVNDDSFLDEDIDLQVETASRDIDEACGQRFYTDGEETRILYARPAALEVFVGPFVEVVSLNVDSALDGTYATEWEEGEEYLLEPWNAPALGRPWRYVSLRRRGGAGWPPVRPNVQLVGVFGWNTVPSQIKTAAGLLANRYLKRAREAPFAIVAGESAATRLARTDPDVYQLLRRFQVPPFQG
jgi:hypothetical protein